MNNYFNDPQGIELARISKIYGLSSQVNAKVAADTSVPTYRNCAIPESTRYPIDSPERTMLSWCYVNEDRSLEPKTRERAVAAIKKAADYWAIELPKVPEKAPAETFQFKVASEKAVDTIVVRNAVDVRDLVDKIASSPMDYSYDTRRQIAEGILSTPQQYRELLTGDDYDFLDRTAGNVMVTPMDVKCACDIRAVCLEEQRKPELAKMLREAGNAFKDTVPTKQTVIKLANLLDYADRTGNLDSYMKNGTLIPAEHSLEGVPARDVERFLNNIVVLKTGSATVKEDLANNREKIIDFFKKIIGYDVSDRSDADIASMIENLSEVDARAFTDFVGTPL